MDSTQESSVKGKTVEHTRSSELDDDTMLQAAALIFGELVDELAPPMRALSVRELEFGFLRLDY